MPLNWSPPQRKRKLTKGGSEALMSSNSSLTSNISNRAQNTGTNTNTNTNATNNKTNTTKSTASSSNHPQSDDDTLLLLKQPTNQQQQQHTSAPLKLGNSKLSFKRSSTTANETMSTSESMQSLYSTNSTTIILEEQREEMDHYGLFPKSAQHYPHQSKHQHHHHHHHHHSSSHIIGRGGVGSGGSACSNDSGSSNSSSSSNNRLSGGSSSTKRGKKQNWGSRDRAGMSFLIVIAFFGIFGLIVLMELFMIDERSHTGMMALRHGNNIGSRSGDSMPDYDNVKDDYDLLDENLLSDNKLGFVQFRDNKLKIQDAEGDGNGRVAGVLLNSGGSETAQAQRGGGAAGNADGAGGGGIVRPGGMSTSIIPWGKILSTKVEETLPHFPIGTQPMDGAWQVVNGTRFKFFVFSAYYDRRDGAKLVRVIGATKTRTPERVWCRFWYPPQSSQQQQQNKHQVQQQQAPAYTSATVMARVKVIRENWNLKYSAVFVLCPVRPAELEVPHHVSIVARLRTPPGNLLQLRNTDWDPDFAHLRTPPAPVPPANITNAAHNATTIQQLQWRERNRPATMSSAGAEYLPFGLPTDEQIPDKIAVCVKPFHFNYDQALYLMEFLEFYALMGVAHFTFYNHTLGPHATCVLQHYIDGDIPNTSSAWDVDLTEVLGRGVSLMGQDAAKVDAVLSGYYNLNNNNNNNNNYNKNNDGMNLYHKSTNPNDNVSNQTGVAAQQTPAAATATAQTKQTTATAEVTGALQPPPPPPPPVQPQLLPPRPPVLQPTLPPAKRYKSTNYVKPTINILPWNLRMRSQKEIRTEGLFAALNDCLYRTMHRYRYVAMVDLDEFIVPRHNDTLNELINSLNHRFRYRSLGAYSFQNAFFYLQFPDDPLVTQAHSHHGAALMGRQEPYAHTNPALRASLVTQRKTRRRLKLHPQKQRSKYICKPESVIEAGNHFIWEFSPAKGSLNVPPTDGILQHYRVCEFGGNDCIKAPSVVDRTATKYVNRLVERVELVYKHLKQRCDLPALPNQSESQERFESQQQKQQQQQRKEYNQQSTGKLLKAEQSAKAIDNKMKNNNNNNSKGVNKKRESLNTSDDERIRTLVNVKSKLDNDREINSNSRNSATMLQRAVVLNKLNTIDPTVSPAHYDDYKVIRKKRKIVVFEQDEEGLPIARLDYVDN